MPRFRWSRLDDLWAPNTRLLCDQPPHSQYPAPRYVSNEKMDLGASFLAKLEPFLLISKSAKGAAAAKLILDATSSPGVLVFGELLDAPSIQEVRTRQS